MSKKEYISEEELERQAPLLFGLKKSPIEAPSGYLEHLEERMMERILSEKTPVLAMKRSKTSTKLWTVAAGLALLLGLILFLQNTPDETSIIHSEAQLDVNLDRDIDYLMDIEEDILFEALAYEQELQCEARIDFLLEDEDFDLDELIQLEL